MNSIITVGSLVSQYLGSIHDAVATFERTNPTIVALNDQIRGFERAAVRSVSSQFDEIVFSPGADPRTNQWALMEPALPLLLAAGYLVGVGTSCFVSSKIGKAAKLNPKNFSVVYNIVMVALSLYMSVETVLAARESFGWDKERDPRLEGLLTVQLPGAPGFSWLGNGMDGQGGDRSAWATPGGQRLANVLYIHYISKYVEFVDTFLMILRQSWSQISFLHVYHHASTALSWYLIMRYNPGGECYWVSAANSMVHVFMYSYYAFAAAGFSARKFGFMKACKPWITRTQMAQFVSFLVQSVFLAIGTKQPVILPRMPVALEFFQGAMFLTLFSMFYLEDRRKAMQASVEKKASAATAPLVVEDVPGASRPSRRVVEESESKEAEDDTSDSKASASGVRQRRSGRVAIAE